MSSASDEATPGNGAALGPEELPRLSQLLSLLRSRGVAVFRYGSLYVEFAREATAYAGSELPTMPATDKCKCGHNQIVEHNDAGLCLEGCAPEICAREAQ